MVVPMADGPRRLVQLVERLEGAGWRICVEEVAEQPYPAPWLYAACRASRDGVSISASWMKDASPGARWRVRLISVSVGRDAEKRFVHLAGPADVERLASWSTPDIVGWLEDRLSNR